MALATRALPIALLAAACTPSASPPPTGPDAAAASGIEGDLHGAFLELECRSPEIELQFCQPKDMGKRTLTLHFGGDPARSYDVVLKVWGVVEGVKYQGGEKVGYHFYIGGESGTPDTATYSLQVGDQRYYLNHFENGAGEHYTYAIEYTAPAIPIPGGATVLLSVDSPDDLVNTNHMETAVAAPPPALRQKLEKMQDVSPLWQYVYIEVGSLRPR